MLSMGHRLRGSLELPGRAVDFDGGLGYLEKRQRQVLSQSYLWLQCSDFSQPCSIFLSLARIPSAASSFQAASAPSISAAGSTAATYEEG